MSNQNHRRDFAMQLLKAGLCVVPAFTKEKQPVSKWKSYQRALPNEVELTRMLRDGDGLCIVAGAVSGNLEVIDFDMGGELYPAWRDAVEAALPGLRDRLYVERTPSGGKHVIYRSQDAVEGNTKLAQRSVPCKSEDETELAGKRYKP
ncbi:MAG: bifunctional DNA primase/polymerase, partial [Phycisphaerae bacterium]